MKPTPRTRGRVWRRIRERQLHHHPLCARCFARDVITEACEVDHVVPLFKGGTDHESNLQSLCAICHAEKTAEDQGHAVSGCDERGFPINPAHPWFK
jgi:5-methylcytosine-specific restriction enzyme A